MTEAHLQGNTFELEHTLQGISINGQPRQATIQKEHPLLWHVTLSRKPYPVLLQKIDSEAKTVTLTVNGKRVEVKIRSRMEKLLQQLGMGHHLTKKVDSVKAPMPGLIRDVQVEVGQTVEKDDPLLILEAMKMENVIKSPESGVIKSIEVTPGASVEKNALLIKFE